MKFQFGKRRNSMFVQWECGCQGLMIKVEGKDKPYVIKPCRTHMKEYSTDTTFFSYPFMRDRKYIELGESGIGAIVTDLNIVCKKAQKGEEIKKALAYL